MTDQTSSSLRTDPALATEITSPPHHYPGGILAWPSLTQQSESDNPAKCKMIAHTLTVSTLGIRLSQIVTIMTDIFSDFVLIMTKYK